MRYAAVLLFLCIFALGPPATARADGGSVVLVIGNGAYRAITPLDNPTNDARLARDLFAGLGFDVSLAIDTDAEALRAELARFREKSADADTAVMYFAGHGIQANNENYLLTVDTQGETLDAAIESSVSMDEVIAAFADSARAKLLFVDACRNNPFEEATRAIGAPSGGLARVGHELSDLLVVYAAQPNRVAMDGRNGNSPFMAALSAILTRSPVPSLQDALIDVTNHVRTETSGRQTPYIEGSLSFHVRFGPQDVVTVLPDIPAQCTGPARDIALEDVEKYLDLAGADAHLLFGDQVRVCPGDDAVHVSGPFSSDLSCETLLTSSDGGAGYYFNAADGVPHHLWFYVNPDRDPHALEIGIYRDGEESRWIDTNIQVCQPG